MIKIKRIYERPEKADGLRVLIDRLWPRGLSLNQVKIDLWLKEIAPSNELRKSFSHDPKKWSIFKKKYANELKGKSDLMQKIKEMEQKEGTVTLLYSAKDEKYNNAIALYETLKKSYRNNLK